MNQAVVSKKSAKRAELRENRLDQLEKLMLEEGFRSLTISGLAKHLRCSQRSLYEIAPSKEEIFLVTMERWLDKIRRSGVQSVLEEDDPKRQLEAYTNPGVSGTLTVSRQFVEDVRSYKPAKRLLDAHQRERMKFLQSIVENGIRKKVFRDVHSYLVAEVLFAAVQRADNPAFLEEASLSMSEAFEEIYDIILHGLFIE